MGWAALLALALWGMLLVDLQYGLFAAWIVVPYGLLTVWQAPGWAGRVRPIAGALLAGLGALLLWWVAGPLPYLLDYDRGALVTTPADAAIAIPFPDGYISHLVSEGIPVSLGAVLLPLLALALVLNLYARQQRIALPARRWFWLALVPAPLILSAGVAITVAGVRIPLPYTILHELLGGMFRYPERFAPVLLIPAVIFIMQTLTPLLASRHGRQAVPVILLLVVLIDARLFHPFPIQPIPTPYHFYEVMGEEPYDYVVLDVPTGASSGEALVGEPVYASLEYYGITHGKRMINGHFARVDPAHFWSLRGAVTIAPDGLREVTFSMSAPDALLTLSLDYGDALPVEGTNRALALLVDYLRFERTGP